MCRTELLSAASTALAATTLNCAEVRAIVANVPDNSLFKKGIWTTDVARRVIRRVVALQLGADNEKRAGS